MALSPNEVQHSTSTLESVVYPGTQCVVHSWSASYDSSSTKAPEYPGVVILYHGYSAHALYPSVKYAAEFLAKAGYLCYAMDLPGHGSSPGTRGYVEEPSHLTDDGMAMAEYVHAKHPNQPLVLFGTSMGGAIALNVARRCHKLITESQASTSAAESNDVAATDASHPNPVTCVLLAPMLGIAESNLPPAWQESILRFITKVAPSAALLGGSAMDNSVQFRDPVRRLECTNDELSYKGRVRLATACSCLDTATELSSHLQEIHTPFLCLVAGKEVVVDPQAHEKLMSESSTDDQHKKVVVYPEACHGLMCEPPEERTKIEKEILDWIKKYV